MVLSNIVRFGAYGILVLLVGGCSSTPTVKTYSGSVTASLIHKRVRANLDYIQTLSGSGNISVESREMAGSGSFEIALRKPDSLLLKFEGPFGLEVGTALVTRKEFLLYNSLQNQLITGETNSANLSRYLRMNVSFDDLLNLFAGSAFFSEDEKEADTFTTEDNQYVLTYTQANRTRKYWIDPTTLLILKVQHWDSHGTLVAEQGYSNYRTVSGATFPSSIRFTMNAEQRALSIHYGKIDVNTNALTFLLGIPENAKRLRIQ